jgi:hypothetical protein
MSLIKPETKEGYYIKMQTNKKGEPIYYQYKQTNVYVKIPKELHKKKKTSVGSGVYIRKQSSKTKIKKLLKNMDDSECNALYNYIFENYVE